MYRRCPVEFMILYREFGGNLWIRQEILFYNLTFFAQQVEYVTIANNFKNTKNQHYASV